MKSVRPLIQQIGPFVRLVQESERVVLFGGMPNSRAAAVPGFEEISQAIAGKGFLLVLAMGLRWRPEEFPGDPYRSGDLASGRSVENTRQTGDYWWGSTGC